MKECKDCRQTVSVDQFYRHRQGDKEYTGSYCKRCHLARGRRYRAEKPALYQVFSWKQQGIRITVEQYESMRVSQGERCAICGTDESVSGRRLAVDHDHSTGEIRGLLCNSCNVGLGWFLDDPSRLEQAAEYLRNSRKETDSPWPV